MPSPALRRRPALDNLDLSYNPFGDEGLAALLAPPPPEGTPPLPAAGLKKLKEADQHVPHIRPPLHSPQQAFCRCEARASTTAGPPAQRNGRLYRLPAPTIALTPAHPPDRPATMTEAEPSSLEMLRKQMQYPLIKVRAPTCGAHTPCRHTLDCRVLCSAELRHAGGDAAGLRRPRHHRHRALRWHSSELRGAQ